LTRPYWPIPFRSTCTPFSKAPPADGAWAMVYGAGVLGLLSVAVLRVLFPKSRVAIVARYPHQAEIARQMGAERVIQARDAQK